MALNENRILILSTLPLLIGAASLVALRRPEPLRATLVQTVAVHGSRSEHAPDTEQDSWLGVIVAGYSADVGAEVGGTVSETFIAAGAHVKAGAPLLRIEESEASDDMHAARAKLEQQRSQVARAEAEVLEASDLVARLASVPSGVSDRQMLAARSREQQAKAALREAQAGIGVQQAALEQQRNRSQKYVIRAPFDGIAVERFVDPGALVSPGQVVARIINGDYYVRFAMSPAVARQEAVGQSVRVEFDGRSIHGVVSDIQPEVDAASQLVFARARLDVPAQDAAAVLAGARVRVCAQPGSSSQGGG